LKPNFWAAAIPTSAGGDTNQIEKIAKTPVWHHQGSTDGTAGRRMSKALEDHKYKVVRVVVDFTINSPSGWSSAMQGGAKPEDVAFKNAKAPVTLDSLRRAISGGANYLYTELTGGNHEAGWMGAAHNPLLATWAFSKVKNGATVSIQPYRQASHFTKDRYRVTLLSPQANSGQPTFSILGQFQSENQAGRPIPRLLLSSNQ
jgi:hypothetical protein